MQVGSYIWIFSLKKLISRIFSITEAWYVRWRSHPKKFLSVEVSFKNMCLSMASRGKHLLTIKTWIPFSFESHWRFNYCNYYSGMISINANSTDKLDSNLQFLNWQLRTNLIEQQYNIMTDCDTCYERMLDIVKALTLFKTHSHICETFILLIKNNKIMMSLWLSRQPGHKVCHRFKTVLNSL